MATKAKKIYDNQAVKLSKAVAAARLNRTGITLDSNVGITVAKTSQSNRFPRGVIKRLAGT